MRQAVWAVIAVGALSAAIVAWRAPGAGADSSVSQSGQVGTHFLFDEPGDPGARCLFSPGTGVFSITVDGPYVLGLDRSPDAEQTEVSWRAIAVRNGVQVQASAPIVGAAFETQSARFTDPIVLTLLDPTGVYTALVEVTWYESAVSGPPVVLGTSVRRVDVYALNLAGTGGPDTIVGSCQAVAGPTPEPTATATLPPLATSTLAPTATNPPAPTATVTPAATVPTAPTATATTAAGVPTSTPTVTPTPAATATPQSGPSGPPRLTMSASRGTVNAKIRLELAGFPANAFVEVTFAGVTVAAITTTPSGTASIGMAVPAKPKGSYEVRATTAAASAGATYEIVPRVKVIPGSAGPGDTVEVSLRGFAKNERVRIRWLVDGRWVELFVVERTSNTGSANVFVTVPAGAAPGPAKVRGDGAVARAQTNAFLVTE